MFKQEQESAAKTVEQFSYILLLTKYLSAFYCQTILMLITGPELPNRISWEIPG